MKMIDIIKDLQKEGHSIEYRKRSDGGYIITAINGVKYTGAKGNTFARGMIGLDISEAKKIQLSFNVYKYIKGKKKPKKTLENIAFNKDIELLIELKRVQRAFRKVKAKGKITKRKLRYYYITEGRERAFEYLHRRREYARGIAYPENVIWLAFRMERKASEVNSQELYDLAQVFKNNKHIFREEWIHDCYEIIYDIPLNISVSEGIKRLHTKTGL